MSLFVTAHLAASAYNWRAMDAAKAECLTHAVEVATGADVDRAGKYYVGEPVAVLCRAKVASVLPDLATYSSPLVTPPTCPVCARRVRRAFAAATAEEVAQLLRTSSSVKRVTK